MWEVKVVDSKTNKEQEEAAAFAQAPGEGLLCTRGEMQLVYQKPAGRLPEAPNEEARKQ